MKRILLLVPQSQKRADHMDGRDLQAMTQDYIGSDITVDMSALSNLTFVQDGAEARVYDAAAGYDLADFDLVVFRTIGRRREEVTAAAAYCRVKGVPYIDRVVPMGGNKLACVFLRYEQGLRVPPTAYGPADELAHIAGTGHFAYPIVLKSTNGKKGRDNYLVRSDSELHERIAAQPDVAFIMQQFIPNDGDYRILVLNGKPRLAILRRAAPEGGHLNNTSQGGSAEIVPLASIAPEVLDLAVQASELEGITIAGADIITERGTGTPYILEVNRSPQLNTGAFTEEKIAEYAAVLRELAEKQASTAGHGTSRAIGRRERVAIKEFPALGLIAAKIDTGAYSNSLHCDFIEETVDQDGRPALTFSPHADKREVLRTHDFKRRQIVSSNGIAEERYVVTLHVIMGGQTLQGSFSLTDRSSMMHPMLIGRKFLRQHALLVDVTKRFSI